MKNNNNNFLDKNSVSFIKGIAIILMIIHHSFGFPEYYCSNISYPLLKPSTEIIQFTTKICVALFAFLTGWSYSFKSNQSYKHSLKKIITFLIDYWIIYFPILLISILIGGYNPTIKDILLEMIGANSTVMLFYWYVFFYLEIIIIMPMFIRIVGKLSKNTFLKECIYSIIFYFFILILVNNIKFIDTSLNPYLPVVISGYLSAKYNILEICYEFITKIFKKGKFIIGFILINLSMVIHLYIPSIFNLINMRGICATLMILGILLIYNNIPKRNIISFLGIHSMNIWLIHCIFFEEYTREIFQPIVYVLKNPILVVISILFVCTLISIMIKKSKILLIII